MNEIDIAYLQNLAIKYPPKVILYQLSQVYFRRATALKEELEPGTATNISIVRAKAAWEHIGNLASAKFKDDGFI